MFKKSLIVILLLSSVVRVSGQYYVSSSGSDSNSGTLTQPFKTIQKAANIMIAGDTCYIMAGMYRETVTPANNGLAGSHLVFTNYQNEKVIILGTDSITGWIPYREGIYKAYAPDTVWQLFLDTVMANEARYPNFKGNHLSTSDWAPVTTTSTGTATFNNMNFPSNYWNGGHCFAVPGKKWLSQDGIIDSSGGNMVRCNERSIPWATPATSADYIGTGLGFITHHINALDTINEWFWQNDTLYYFPQDPLNIPAEARTRMYGFDCKNKKYIEINNLNFAWSTVSFENATGCVLNNSNVLYPTPYYYFTNPWNVSFGIGNWAGVAVSGNDNIIKNCYVAHSWGNGITLNGKHNTVDNCLVEDCDWSANEGGPVTMTDSGHVVKYSTLRHTGRSVIVHHQAKTILITHNNLYDCGYLTSDLGFTYAYGTNGVNSEISYNWAHDNHSPIYANGIYFDSYDSNMVAHHNVIWNLGAAAVHTNTPALNIQIYNNTAWACGQAMDAYPTKVTTNQVVRNNLSNKVWNIGNTFSNNLVSSNPLFTDAANFDFTLTSASPAIDYGTVIPGITDGFVGSAPDAGAYEYGVTPWIPGSNVLPITLTDLFGNPSTGILSVNTNNSEIKIFPNPTNGIIIIQRNANEQSISKIEIVNELGEKVYQSIISGPVIKVDLSSQPKGIYFYTISNAKNIVSGKLIIQ